MKNLWMAATQKRADLRKQATAIIDAAKVQGRDLNAEEQATYEKTLAALKQNEEVIAVEEKKVAAEMAMTGHVDDNMIAAARATGIAPPFMPSNPKRQLGKTGPKYADMFGPATRASGFASFGEFLQAWHHQSTVFDPRLRAGQVEDIPSLGGSFVPDEYAAAIIDAALETEIVRPRAQIWPMSSETRKVPGLDGFDHTSNLYGGFTANWLSEAQPIPSQTVKTRLVGLTANKLALLGSASNELIADADALGFEAVYGASMIAAISWFLDFYNLQGNGAGQPRGVLNDPALVTVAKESGQIASTIVYENVTKMFSRLHPACFKNAVWVCNSTAIPQLLAMQNRVFNLAGDQVVGGSAVPVVDQRDDGTMVLLTREIIFTEKLPALGAVGDIVLADFSKYAVGMRRGAALEQSAHAGFSTFETVYRIVTRCDGQGLWKSAVTPKNGSSLSWCVTLAART